MDGTLGSGRIGRLSLLHRFVSLGISAPKHRIDGAWNASDNARHFSG
jgi:hypothetical protein